MNKPFNREEAEAYLNKLIKQYNIKVVARSKTSCGTAWCDRNEIKIPYPTNEDRFAVCLHEVHHIMEGDTRNGKKIKRYEQEFYADMFARDTLAELGYDTTYTDKRNQWHILSRIAMATNRGLKEINPEIVEYFNYVDFSKWIGNKVFVSCNKKYENQRISIKIDDGRWITIPLEVPSLIKKSKPISSDLSDDFEWTDERVLEFGKVVTMGSYGDYDGCKTMVSKLKRFKELKTA